MDAAVPKRAAVGRLMVGEALEELQIRLTHQEAAIDELTTQSLRQQRQIDELVGHLEKLQAQLRELTEAGASPQSPEPPPPHY